MPANPKKSKQKIPLSAAARWQRFLLAFFSVSLIAAGLLIDFLPNVDASSSRFLSGTLLKVGLVLGLAWVSAPQLERLGWQRIRGTLLVAIIIIVVLYAIRPKIGAIAAALLVGGSLVFSLVGWFRNLTQPPRR